MVSTMWRGLLVLSALSGALCASDVSFEPSDMPITDVTVYESSGQIQRQLRWKEAKPGEHLLQLRGLPFEMDESTFYIKATSELTVIDTSVAVRMISPEDNPDMQVQSLRDKLKAMVKELMRMEQEEKKVNQKIDLIKDFGKTFLQTTANQGTKSLFAEFKELLKLSDEALAESYDQRTKLAFESKQLKKEADDLEKQITVLVADKSNRRQVKDVSVRVRVPSTAKPSMDIQVVYHQHGCSWQPEYEIKVSSREGSSHATMPLSMEYFARIRQSSYEDWSNVRLTLATNAPHRTASPPTLYSTFATMNPPFRAKTFARNMADGAPEMMAMPQAAASFAGAAMMDASYDAAQIDNMGVLGTYTFTIAEKVSVASSHRQGKPAPELASATMNAGVRVLVEKIPLSGKPFVWSVPGETETPFFQLLCKNSRTVPILPSRRANVYVDGALVAQTNIPHTPVGEVFTLNMGEDRGVKVTHRPMKITSNTDGIISKTRTRPYDTLTTITNQNTQPQVVVIGQAIPKTETSKIQVELVKPDPGDLQSLAAKNTRSHDDEINSILQDMVTRDVRDKVKVYNYVSKATNILYWAAILPPNETVNVPLQYKLSWPDSMGEVYIQNHYT